MPQRSALTWLEIVFVLLLSCALAIITHTVSRQSVPLPRGHIEIADSIVKGRFDNQFRSSHRSDSGKARTKVGPTLSDRYFNMGIGPAVLIFHPYKKATGKHLPQRTVASVMVIGSFVLSVLFVATACAPFLTAISLPIRLLAYTALALGGLGPFIATGVDDADVALAWSRFYISLAAWLFLRAFNGGVSARRFALLGSFSIGLAALGHPSAVALLTLPLLLSLLPSPFYTTRRYHRLLTYVVPCMVPILVHLLAFPAHTAPYINALAFDSAAVELATSATWSPGAWIAEPICHARPFTNLCRELNVGVLTAFPSHWLLLCIPLLLALHRRAALMPKIGIPPLPKAPLLFIGGIIVIQAVVAVSSAATLFDPSHLPPALDWGAGILAVVWGLRAVLALSQELGWRIISSVIVATCLVGSSIVGVLVALLH